MFSAESAVGRAVSSGKRKKYACAFFGHVRLN